MPSRSGGWAGQCFPSGCRSRIGKSLPHSSSAQVSDVDRISRSHARRGDLVFFYGYGGVYHVAIYAGHGYIWHAPHSGTRVRRRVR